MSSRITIKIRHLFHFLSKRNLCLCRTVIFYLWIQKVFQAFHLFYLSLIGLHFRKVEQPLEGMEKLQNEEEKNEKFLGMVFKKRKVSINY